MRFQDFQQVKKALSFIMELLNAKVTKLKFYQFGHEKSPLKCNYWSSEE